MGKFIFRKIEIGQPFFWKTHGILAHLRILTHKIFPAITSLI